MSDVSKEQQARIALTNARLQVNDFHACSTADELDRWRATQLRLIEAAGAVQRLEVEALRAELARLRGQTCATCLFREGDDTEDGVPTAHVCVEPTRCHASFNLFIREPVGHGCNQWAARDTATPEGAA